MLDPRLQGNGQDDLIESLKTVPARIGAFPARRGWGTAGTPVTLRVNYFPVTFPDTIYEYNIGIEPSVAPGASQRRRILQLLEEHPEFSSYVTHVAHDYDAKLYSSQPLRHATVIQLKYYEEGEVGPSDRSKAYTVTIIPVKDIKTGPLKRYLAGDPDHHMHDPLPVITALNVIIGQYAFRNGGFRAGRNKVFFGSGGNVLDLGGGLEAFKGFFSSVRPSYQQLMVNVNVCTAAFYRGGNLADAIRTFWDFGGRDLNTFFSHVKVETSHLGFKARKTVCEITNSVPKTQTFPCTDFGGAHISVFDYFMKKYKIRIKHDQLPVVNVGTRDTPTFLPPELCTLLPGQPFRGKLSDTHTAHMIKYACQPPNVNVSTILGGGMQRLGFAPAQQPLQRFGITVGQHMAVVPGRVLPAPIPTYAWGTAGVDDRASWNMRNVQFVQGATLANWAVLVLRAPQGDNFDEGDDRELRDIIRNFSNMCAKSGMKVQGAPPPIHFAILPASINELSGAIEGAVRGVIPSPSLKPSVIMVILSNKDSTIYSMVKYLCDTKLDVQTVCVQATNIRKGQPQYYANVALKFNVKLGGVNHTLDTKSLSWLRDAPTMLMGADVTHPSPFSVKGTPSIAAVVGSVDDMFGQYPASMRLQLGPRESLEMIQDLEGMMVERFNSYYRTSGMLPRRIIFFRDGVSEGQFKQVVAHELPQIKRACEVFGTMEQPYNPALSIIIAGKRHHTRFYPIDNVGMDRTGNARAGTVVDRGITAIYDSDFYLQAHAGLQGTTKSTHYYPVYDENDLDADTLQGLTNNISYLYARATKAVSLAPPAYYSDLACERGRCYLHELMNSVPQGRNSQQGGQEKGKKMSKEEEEAEKLRVFQQALALWGNGIGPGVKETMFYI
ncbi:hypothetical protein BOTBODRAFT_169326 [Botryobasidium botryosum FD-172 SS1]|uniref:Piwi domain-containing protein n=1 Tax=Botryobasidium botryosum (strain FD-172 SS1) TaxID=930990 RepID=A0A067N0V9_BOTB1|nr:hypothetical protein BOTBODRAFT_169326 [Botryobasidium botryosum FD-172 SS1]